MKEKQHKLNPQQKTIAIVAMSAIFVMGFFVMIGMLSFTNQVVQETQKDPMGVSGQLPLAIPAFEVSR